MQNNIVKKEFDLKADDYESNRLANWYKAHAHEILKHCPAFNEGDILDIGCATGYQLRLLSQNYPKARLVGLDLSSRMTGQAAKLSARSPRHYQFINDDWENLSAENRSILRHFNFKLILCANTLHYFIDPRRAIKQMYEMLDNDGMLLVLEREKTRSPLTSIWGLVHRHLIKDQVEFYSAEDVKDQLSGSGFLNVKIVSTIRKYFWKGKLFTSIAVIKGNKLNG